MRDIRRRECFVAGNSLNVKGNIWVFDVVIARTVHVAGIVLDGGEGHKRYSLKCLSFGEKQKAEGEAV